jgi:hypothetical protein
VLDALRHGRTVAYDGQGNFVGDPARVEAVKAHLARLPPPDALARRLQRLATAGALLGLLLLVILR